MEAINTVQPGGEELLPPQKRIRLPTQRLECPSRDEQKALEQALKNSVKDQVREPSLSSVPFGPTFHPTVEEFSGDPLVYIEKIRHQAEKYGICKIVPPKGWNPPFAINMDNPKKFQTKDQSIHRLQEGISFGDGKDYNAKEYQKMCSDWSKEWKKKHYSTPTKPSAPTHILPPIGGVNPQPVGTVGPMSGVTSQPPTLPSIPMFPSSAEQQGSQVLKAEEKLGGEEEDNLKKMTPKNLERDYWDIVEKQCHEIDVDYGNDVDTSDFGSGFPLSERGRSVNSPPFQQSGEEPLEEPAFGTDEFYKETFWNLNNIPNSKNSVLRHLKVGINGINVPWLYFGCLFSTFCWHNEDNYMYSINYHHKGAPKQWYGVPGTKKDADGVEQVFKSYLSMKMRDVPDLLHHITTSFSPRLLTKDGVRVCKILQQQGEFIVTFPRAFHGGFSLGPNCGEAVNFALHDWIPHAVDANERYRTFGRASVFSHDRLVYTMAHHCNELRTKEICSQISKELTRLMNEEMLLRQKLISAGVRDVSGTVDIPPNRLDQLDEDSADYDDKRLCHSCKHICFLSAVCCECSSDKVSCLRHSHYMCRCSVKRKFMLVWTPEEEMKRTIMNVEKRKEELGDDSKAAAATETEPKAGSKVLYPPLQDAPGSSKDRLFHQSYEVPITPICNIEPELVSDTSVSSRSQGDSSMAVGQLKAPPEQSTISSSQPMHLPPILQPIQTSVLPTSQSSTPMAMMPLQQQLELHQPQVSAVVHTPIPSSKGDI